MAIVYAVVARGRVILSEFSAVCGNTSAVSRRILEKLPNESDSRLCFSQDRYIFHILRSDGITFLCIANDTFGRRVPFSYLEDIHMRFMKNYGKVAHSAPTYAMNDEFSRVLHQQMEFFSSNPSADTLNRMRGEVGEIRTIMVENIEKILERGDRIELLVNETSTMQDGAFHFRKQSRRLHRALWMKNAKLLVASAPGKVLMTGGYLILERPNAGLVLSTNARFYAIVKPIYDHLQPDSWAWAWTDVKLTSPQLSRQNTYKLSLRNSTLRSLSSKDPSNPFVEQAVQFAVAAAHAICIDNDLLHKLLLQGFDITILGSNDFYSYRNQIEALGLPLTPESLASLPTFSSITFNAEESTDNTCKPEVAKTGLGSSAAMTTAVVSALLQYLGVVNLPLSTKTCYQAKDEADLDLLHVVAQTAHCIAQGKVGSGFDVSAAVYGSQCYVRFSPQVLSSGQVAVHGQSLQEAISDVLKAKWDHEKTKFCLPPLMTLLLGEPGTGGSSTPSMVGAVKKWQVSEPQKSVELWRMLSEANSILETQLTLLSSLAEEQWETYESVICSCSGLGFEQWKEQATGLSREAVVNALLGARDAFFQIRSHMRLMGIEAGVPIEPESQTQLLDATMNLEGVLLAGVPGAGGFDAIFAVTLGKSSNNVTQMWSSRGVLAMLVREDPQGVSLQIDDPRVKEITTAISSVHVD